MDQALKQRLIGAAVLVALAVIFVPLLLDVPEQAPPASTLPLDMPATPNSELHTRKIPLDLPPPGVVGDTDSAAENGPPPAPADPNQVVTVDADNAKPRAVEPGQGPSAPPETPAAVIAAEQPQPAPPGREVATAPRPAAEVPPPPQPPAPPVAASAPSNTAPASAQVAGRYFINLGSFGNRQNAEGLRQRLQGRGVNVLVEQVSLSSGPAQRLRAGPYRSRADAEKAMLTLARAEPGNAFAVVELDAEEAPAAVRRGAFAVQVGALKDEAEANALRDRLRGAGYAAYVARAQTDAGVLWRVRAGPELNRDRANQVRDELKSKLQLDGMVVSHP
ncbi:SPOR domain-containing protein [Pseudomarimonas arenosa]|uniref:SPOR domain-containing protein n=1 Tax=Pseudomarimonas arenosa TaxID=2774145 RepID=A0AAW3ZQY6_9GAMM|nr:SPOR domain-containing protein [Pseudomarimonas arenosa]MBD8527320.1 SPOR domain-containing protein [Pseudomarimonas arenosa]